MQLLPTFKCEGKKAQFCQSVTEALLKYHDGEAQDGFTILKELSECLCSYMEQNMERCLFLSSSAGLSDLSEKLYNQR